MKNENKNPFVGIAASTVALMIPIVALIVIFAPAQAWVLAVIAAVFAFMAIRLGRFAADKK